MVSFFPLLEQCSACDAGTYQNASGASSCINCAAGYYSGRGLTQCAVCEPEEYALNDGAGCLACADSTECPCMTYDKCFNGTGRFVKGISIVQ